MNRKKATSKYSIVLFFTLFTTFTIAQDKNAQNIESSNHFDGFYIGLSASSQNIFGGAFIDDLDVLGQKNGFVTELSSGYRKQIFKNQLLVGVELQFGITDGNLNQIDVRNQFNITYENNNQFGYGINLGIALGKKKNILFYTYGYITRRKFDITITPPAGTGFNQEDIQKIGRYGFGLEIPTYKHFNLKATFGQVYVDFGDLETNMNVEDKADFSLGIIYQF